MPSVHGYRFPSNQRYPLLRTTRRDEPNRVSIGRTDWRRPEKTAFGQIYNVSGESHVEAETLHPLFQAAIRSPTASHVGLPTFGFRDFQRPLFTRARQRAYNVVTSLAHHRYTVLRGDSNLLTRRDKPLTTRIPSASVAENLRASAVANRLLRGVPGAITRSADGHNTPVFVTTNVTLFPHGVQSTYSRLRTEYGARQVTLKADPDAFGLSFHALRRFLYVAGDAVRDDVLVMKMEERERRQHNVAAAFATLSRLITDAEKANHGDAFVPAKVVRVDKPRGEHALDLVARETARERPVAHARLQAWSRRKALGMHVRSIANDIHPVRTAKHAELERQRASQRATVTTSTDAEAYTVMASAGESDARLRERYFRDELHVERRTVALDATAEEGVFEEVTKRTVRLSARVAPALSAEEQESMGRARTATTPPPKKGK
eukprot:TRINITY_DN5706_c0_g1_i1.p1 TRINITY_DN5706_c0_g1~~TRINITY_DN5706_c0_g1_i1.p1  ORF type:complete len:435 (-),score=77.58 TRINITY_DN5706_c0_g1_i1:120-1424(-)